MRTAPIALALLFCAATASAQAPQGFLTKWSDAMKAAAREKKPIYIHFTTTWCKWCRQIEKDTYPDPAVKKALADFVCVSLDCTEPKGEETPAEVKVNLSLMEKLGGGGYPFLVMVTGDGVTLNTVDGYVPPEVFVQELAKAKAACQDYLKFQAYAAKADKKGYEYNLKALAFYQKVRNEEHALSAAQKVLELDPDNKKGDHVLAKLAQLDFSTDTLDNTQSLMEEICKLDPLNKNMAYEKAVLIQARRELYAARSDQSEAAPHFEAIVKLADKARAGEVKLAQPYKLYSLAAMANFRLNQYDKAIESAERALAASKDPQESKEIKTFIDQVKEVRKKAQAEPSSEPGTAPARKTESK